MHRLDVSPGNGAQTFTPELSETERKVFRILRTVLLAEDDDDLRYVMECSLKAMGYLVVACADAEIASAAFRSHPAIDILLTDVEMPGRSGIELARELTALRPALPVIVITGSLLSTGTMQEICDRRWNYFGKPCRLSVLESTMKALLMSEQSLSDA